MKQLGLDEYAHLQSPIHQWEVRYKLVGLLALVIAFSFVRDIWLLPGMYLITILIFRLSNLPWSYLITRLKLPGYFLLALAIMLPLISGQTIVWQLGPIAVRLEGLQALILIVSRFVCIITLTLVLFGTASFMTSIKGLRAVGLPSLLADMILLTYRYLFEMSNDLNTMRVAIRLRGFNGRNLNRHNLTVLASLVGSLLVRSYEQSERVYKAMILRGYGNRSVNTDTFVTQPFDRIACVGCLSLAVGMIATQVWFSFTL